MNKSTNPHPGPGVTPFHIQGVQNLANQTGMIIFIHGSRQTGFSVHTGKPFEPDTDLDLGVVGSLKSLSEVVHGDWASIKNVSHAPMRVIKTVDEAMGKGFFVVFPMRNTGREISSF